MISLRLFGSVIYAWLISAIVVILIGEIVENKKRYVYVMGELVVRYYIYRSEFFLLPTY